MHSFKSVIYPVLWTLLAFCQLPAQEYIVHSTFYGVGEGLSHRFVRHIFQDSRGLIWISTNHGLNRFDGYHFTWFTRETSGLSSNNIRLVVEDPTGWLWVFSDLGGRELSWDHVDLMHSRTLEVVPWNERYPAFLPGDIRHVWSGPERELYIRIANGTSWRLDSAGVLTEIALPVWENFYPCYVSTQHTIWGKQSEGGSLNWLEFDSSGQLLTKVENPGCERCEPAAQDQYGRFWYYCQGENGVELFFVDSTGRRQRSDLAVSALEELGKNREIGIFLLPRDQLKWWINNTAEVVGTNGQNIRFFNKHGKYPITTDQSHTLIGRNGRAWLGTAFGVTLVDIKTSRFQHYLSKKLEGDFVEGQVECRGILEAEDGNLLVNSNLGTFLASSSGEQLEENFLKIYTPAPTPTFALTKDRGGGLWFGVLMPLRKDGVYGEIQWLKRGYPMNASDPQAWTIFEDEGGTIWFGGLSGVLEYLEPGTDTLFAFENYEGFEELSTASIISIFKDRQGRHWLTTTQGLYGFDPLKKNILHRFWTGGTGRFYIPSDNIYAIYQDQSGDFWLASGGDGLIQFTTTGYFRQFTKADGLSSNTLYAICEDDYGNLWISSDHGIIRFNKVTGKSKAFLPKDGLPHHEFNRISSYQSPSGRIYFGSLNGVTSFHPRDFQDDAVRENSPLVLLDILQFERRAQKMVNKLQDFEQAQKIVLQPGDRMVNLEFALLDYDDVDQISYAYRVEGLDESWTTLSDNRLSLAGLPFGNYTLSIRGQSATGVFSKNELAIPIQVLKPLYLRSWFLAAAAMLLLAGVLLFINLRTRALREQKRILEKQVIQRTEVISQQNQQLAGQAEELRKLDKAKSRFFANASHELRTPLTLILGPISSILKRAQLQEKDSLLLQKAQQSGQNLLRLINELLDLSAMESDKLELHEKPVSLPALLRRFYADFESQAEMKNIRFKLDYRGDKNLQVRLDEEKFEKIVFNFLGNAMKFTPAGGQVELRLEEQETTLLLSVTDTGRGIHPEDQPHVFERFFQTNRPEAPAEGGTGIGLALVSEFARLMAGKVWLESKLNEGSVFFFEWPKKIVQEKISPKGSPIVEEEPLVSIPASIAWEKGDDRKPLILIVEDNPDMRDYIRLVLEDRYELAMAENGEEALKFLTGNAAPSLIVSDLMMPVMDGFQLVEALKSDPRYQQIPIIILTARADVRDKLRALRTGVDDYLLKPFEEEELQVRIENLLQRYHERTAFNQSLEPLDPDTPMLQQSGFDKELTHGEAGWLEKLEALVRQEVQNDLLSVDWLAAELYLSERQLRRRLKSLTGLSPSQYIREVRLQEARRLLEDRHAATPADAAWAVSFRDPKHFSQLFRDRFGKLPSSYVL